MKHVESVVIIDDDADMLSLLLERLKHLGYRSSGFTSPHDAVKQIRAAPPDLVISDVRMPVLNGFDVCDLLRSRPATAHIPIIMMTGVSEAKRQLHCLRTPGVYVLPKPFGCEELAQLIQTALAAPVKDDPPAEETEEFDS